MSAGPPLPASYPTAPIPPDHPTAPIPPDPAPAGWWARRPPGQTATIVVLLTLALLVTGGMLLAQIRATDAARVAVEELRIEVEILRGEVEELRRTVDAGGPGDALTGGDTGDLTDLLEDLWRSWLEEQLGGERLWDGLLEQWFGPGTER